jgi:multiple sugar transport system permease protein
MTAPASSDLRRETRPSPAPDRPEPLAGRRGLSSETTNLLKGLAFLSPWIVGFLVFTLVPVALSFYYSLTDYTLLQEPVFIGARNYQRLIEDELFWTALGNTLFYAAMAIPGGLLVSLGLALLLNVKIPGQSAWRTIIFLPSLVPVVASAMLWLWLFNARLGLINVALGWVGIEGPAWLADPDWAMPALVLMSFWGVGHTVVIYLAGLQDVPTELYEAAELDGAGVFGRVWHVTLPMLSPVIFFNLVMAVIGTLQVFEVPYIMTGGGPARSTYFITMFLYDNAFNYLKMGYASAVAWLLLLVILAITALTFWSSGRWVHYEGK